MSMSIRESFVAIQAWTNEVQHLDSEQSKGMTASCLEELLRAIVPTGSIQNAKISQHDGRAIVELALKGTRQVKPIRPRYLWPVHFATALALDLVPGFSLVLESETDRRDKQSHTSRSDTEKIWRLNLKSHRVADYGPIQIGLNRILFHAPSQTRLYERRGADHHYIIPETAVLLRHRFGAEPIGQGKLLAIARKAVKKSEGSGFPFKSDDLVDLLVTLFTISDLWHWAALTGRCPDDERGSFSKNIRGPGLRDDR